MQCLYCILMSTVEINIPFLWKFHDKVNKKRFHLTHTHTPTSGIYFKPYTSFGCEMKTLMNVTIRELSSFASLVYEGITLDHMVERSLDM